MTIRPLKSGLQNKAEGELNEVSNRIGEDLEYIRKWLLQEPHLHVRTDDQWLVTFLRGCKFSLQRTKEKLDYFYTTRTLVPEFFTNRDPFSPEIQEILEVGAILPLPKTADAAGPRILLLRYGACDPEKMSVINIMKTVLMVMDILMMEDDNCAVAGIDLWADLTKFPLNYMKQFTPSVVKKSALCIQSAYPLRIKGIYATNAPSIFEIVFNLIKSFLTEKLKSRMKIYSEANVDKFYNDIPQNLLTKRYGGDVDSLDALASQWKNKFESYKEWFAEDAKYCSNESLRRGKPKTSAEEFGVEGSFRTLSID